MYGKKYNIIMQTKISIGNNILYEPVRIPTNCDYDFVGPLGFLLLRFAKSKSLFRPLFRCKKSFLSELNIAKYIFQYFKEMFLYG